MSLGITWREFRGEVGLGGMWVPEGCDGDAGLYSECPVKPFKNLGWESDIIRLVLLKLGLAAIGNCL